MHFLKLASTCTKLCSRCSNVVRVSQWRHAGATMPYVQGATTAAFVSVVRVGALISVSFLEHCRPAYLLPYLPPTCIYLVASPFAGAIVPCTSSRFIRSSNSCRPRLT